MADETYNIIVADQIASSIAQKLTAIDVAATEADAAVAQLRQDLARLDTNSLTNFVSSTNNITNAVAAQTRAEAQLVTAKARLQEATNKQIDTQSKAVIATQKEIQAQINLQNSITKTNSLSITTRRPVSSNTNFFADTQGGAAALIAARRSISDLSDVDKNSKMVIAAQRALANAAQEPIRAVQIEAEATNAFINSLNHQAATLGLSKAGLAAYKAEQLGVTGAVSSSIQKLEAAEIASAKFFSQTQSGSIKLRAAKAAIAELSKPTDILEKSFFGVESSVTKAARAASAAASGFYSSGTAIRELVTIPREIIEGRGLGRVAGSISVLVQSQGLLTAATLPFIAAFVGVAAVVGGAAFALASYDAQMQKLQLSVMGVGAQSGITANQLKNLADSTAPSAHMSAGSNESLLSGYLRLGVVVPDVLSRISLPTQEYAELSGVKLPEAQKALATALNDPANSFSELERVLGPLSQTTKDHITAIQNQSGAMAAQPALLNAIIDKLKGVDGQLSEEKKTLDQWGEWWGATIRGIQNGLNNLRAPSPDDIVGTNLTRGQRDAQQEEARQVAAQRQATQDAHNKLVSSTVDIDRSTTEGSKRYQVQTLTQQKTQFDTLIAQDKLSLKGRVGTPQELKELANATQGLKDVNDQIDKLNKQPNAPRTAALKTENIYESSMQKYKDQAGLNQLVGPDFQIQQQLNSVVERANNITDPKTGRRAGGLSSSQLTTLRAVIAADIEQKNVQQQMNAVYAESVKPLEDYQNRLTAIARLQKDGTIDSGDAAAATLAANIKERQRTQFGYSQDDDPEAQAAGLRSQATLQGELTTQRQVDLQVNNAIKAAQAQSLTYTQKQIEALRSRLTFEQAITKETAARDALEKTSVAQQQQDLITERQALRDLYSRPNHGGLSQRQFTDTGRSQQLSQIDIDTGAKSGTASSAYLQSNVAVQQQLTDELKTQQALLAQHLITQSEFDNITSDIARKQANANLASGIGGLGDIAKGAFGNALSDYKNPATSVADSLSQSLKTLNDQGSSTFAKILEGQEKANQGFKDLARTIEDQLIGSLIKLGLQYTETQLGSSLGLSSPSGGVNTGAGVGAGGQGALGAIGGAAGGLGQAGASLYSFFVNPLIGFADGGLINGRGGPREDANLAAVSHGEFIVNAASTARHLPVLKAINKGNVSHFANGGYVGANTPYVQSTPVGGTSHTSHTWDFSGASFGNGYSKEQATKDFNDAYDARETKTLGKARVQAVTDTQRYATRQRVKG